LVANCGQADKLVVQNAVTEISDLWENTENACKTRTNDLAEVFKLAEQYEKSHGAVCEWLDMTEQKLEKVPSVGSDVKAVKKQLDAHRVQYFLCYGDLKL
jgi:DNA repair ATPase RecN